MEVEICSQDRNNRAFKLLVHLYTCDKIHVILYVFIHDPFLSHSSINPGPITAFLGLGTLATLTGSAGRAKSGKAILSLCT